MKLAPGGACEHAPGPQSRICYELTLIVKSLLLRTGFAMTVACACR